VKTLKQKALAFFRQHRAKAMVAAGLALTTGAHASGGGSDPSSIVTSASTLLTSIYPIVLGAVSFGILISLVKMVRRK